MSNFDAYKDFIEITAPTLPDGVEADEIDVAQDGSKIWYLLGDGAMHFISVPKGVESYMAFGLKVPSTIGHEVFNHPYAAINVVLGNNRPVSSHQSEIE